MIKIKVDSNSAKATSRQLLTSGTVGLKVAFEFSDDWAELSKTAVFTNGQITIDVLESKWDGNECIIPHECLSTPFSMLKIGVYGVNTADTIVIPTIFADCGVVDLGADPSGDASADPTLPIWEQIKQSGGVDLSDYYTKAETNTLIASAGKVKTVNGIQPDEDGNITVPTAEADLSDYYTKTETNALISSFGRVKSINGVQPDAEGDVTLEIPSADLSGYCTKSELESALGNVASLINAL